MSIFVGAEGFQLGNTFILTVLHLSVGDTDSTDYKHFVFKAPLLPFTAIERRSIRYCTRYLHQISRTEGDVPYSALVPIIKKMESSTLYCYGYTTARFLRKLLPTSIIIDTQTEGYKMPTGIPSAPCFTTNASRHFAASKANAIRKYVNETVQKASFSRDIVDRMNFILYNSICDRATIII